MQKEIKRRAKAYGIVAIISAIVLGALCFEFGVYPPTLMSSSSSVGLFKTFSSIQDLRSFLLTNSKTQGVFSLFGPWDKSVRIGFSSFGALGEAYDATIGEVPTNSYSTTNIQVAGVDEADIVKTDGNYIYLVSNQSIYILKAYPPEQAEVISRITFEECSPIGIFVSEDRLTVLGSKYTYISGREINFFGYDYFIGASVDIRTFANVYDISNRTHPQLLSDFNITGSYFNSRMIGDYVYFVSSQPAYVMNGIVVLPKIYSDNGTKEIRPEVIHYADVSDDYFQYTTVVGLNMQNTTETPTSTTVMLGGTSGMYVSTSNIYVTFPQEHDVTSIYRIHIVASNITCEATGTVLGCELNQFSMDESNGYFRIATTARINGTTQNNLYVLDMNLSLVGKLENIAPNETIDSARFIGSRCYLSTSVVRRDPFFVVDVENASDPQVLGYLKIPGFTRYLHPYDSDHVLGIGKDGNNVKISLFDVSNVSAPNNMSEYMIGGIWSDAMVLSDHRAFLFDKTLNLLAMPVSVDYSNKDQISMWQGLYVFNVTLNNGLSLKGTVTHQKQGINEYDSGYYVNRALYIKNALYTFSDRKIKLNGLEDLALIKEILLS